jgi:hypothetical protein
MYQLNQTSKEDTMTHMLTIKDLETRNDGTFYTGPLAEAQAFIREENAVSVVSRPGGLFTVFISQAGTEIPAWNNVDDYGTAPTEEDAWRYALGGAFGPADDDFQAFPLTHDKHEAVRALVDHHFPVDQQFDVFFSTTTPHAVVLTKDGDLWQVYPDGGLKVYKG